MGRFLMNNVMASGRYPRTVIPIGKRAEYMQALEWASSYQDISPFSKFITYLVHEVMEGKAVAVLPKSK